jgi:hypothetical protein
MVETARSCSTQPSLPMKPGWAGTMTHDYRRHGTSTLMLPGQPDSESDYIASAREIDGHVRSGSILVAKRGGAKGGLRYRRE